MASKRRKKTAAQRTKAAYAKAGASLRKSERRRAATDKRRTKAAYRRELKSLKRFERRRAKREAHLAKPHRILRDTGLLFGSISPNYGPNFVEAFTNVPYGIYHTSSAPRRVIPLRDFFDIDQARVTEDIADLLLASITRSP